MVRVWGRSFEKYHDAIVDLAVGGGIVCSLGEQPLRSLLADTSITFKPQQDVIIQALDELRRNTEASVAALEKSGSPYTFTVVRALRTHNAAYITFTKVRKCVMYTVCGVICNVCTTKFDVGKFVQFCGTQSLDKAAETVVPAHYKRHLLEKHQEGRR